MNNSEFNIKLNAENGTVEKIVNPSDIHKMNWSEDDLHWGNLHFGHAKLEKELPLVSFFENTDEALSIYANDYVEITVKRFFRENKNFVERYIVKNMGYGDLFLNQDNFGISLSFNDRDTYAADCLTNRCSAHFWCSGNTMYVNALRMGVSDMNLGLVLTEGSVHSYSQKLDGFLGGDEFCSRGEFIVNSSPIQLVSGEEYALEWEAFWHNGDDFFEKAEKISDSFVRISVEQYTVFRGEAIKFTAKVSRDEADIKAFANDNAIDFVMNGGILECTYYPPKTGEYKICLRYGNKRTYAEFLCVEKFEEIVKTRLEFIVSNQQYLRKDSPLYGAFLIYDTKEKQMIFDDSFADHNACRERIGMALLAATYLKIIKMIEL